MPYGTCLPVKLVRLLVAAAVLGAAGAALADDYADVNQLRRSGRTAEALAKADQYLVGKPRDPQMRFLRGMMLSEAGRTQDAINAFTRLTEEYPELPEPYNNLAVLYAGQNQYDRARAALEMAIRTNPNYATAHENLGDIYARLASQSYARAAQLDTANTTARPKMAQVQQMLEPPTPAPRARGTSR